MGANEVLIHAYSNCKDNPESAAAVLLSNEIILTERPFSFRSNPSEKIFCSEEALERYMKGYPSSNPFIRGARSKESLRVREANEFSRLAPHINAINEFLKNCLQNPVGLSSFIPTLFRKAVEAGAITSGPISNDNWHMQIMVSTPIIERTLPVEDLVEIMGLLIPLHDLNSNLKLEYTKKCVLCGKFYQAKGKKAIYCSEKCRSRARFHYKNTDK